jgi:mannosylglycoprotein endo-beta-mannosidase
LNEILTAIKAFPKGKAPGNDGLPMEFFHECAEETVPILLQAFTAMLYNGRTSAEINKGVITLIPKSGDKAKLSNWRPITLLGSTYKVLAKKLAGRIKAALTHIIWPNQTGFVEGRSIIDNTFMAQEALEWAEESEQDLVLFLLDFKKAFDRIEWGFLFSALAKLGFSETWIRWVKTLYLEASSAIKVNGTTGPTFQLARSVRHGCPLAPYLFILATDVLGHMLADPRYNMEGLTLPRGGLVRDQTFADDTALYLQGSPSNLDRAENVFNIFCQASGAKVDWHKSAAIWASKNKRDWHWGENVGLKWIPDGEGTRYLGIQVGSHLPPEANFGKMRLSLKNKLISWSNNRLSLTGRILVANQVLLASMWYIAAS